MTILSKRGTITVPKSVREKLGVKAGQRFEVEVMSDGTILVVPIRDNAVGSMRLPNAGKLERALREERERNRKLGKAS